MDPITRLHFDEKYHSSICGLPTEIVQTIFMRCLGGGDVTGFIALSRTNVHSYLCMHQLMEAKDLKQLCPLGLTILDAEEQGFKVDVEPCIGKFTMLKWFKKLAPSVEKYAGLTLLTVPKGITVNELIAIAESVGIEVVLYHEHILGGQNTDPVEKTYQIMMSNALVARTRNKLDIDQELQVKRVGFDRRPTLVEYLLFLISAQKVSNYEICMFEKGSYGRSSTSGNVNVFSFLAVGGDCTCSHCYCIVDHFVKHEDCGAGGVLVLSAFSDKRAALC